MTVDERFFAKTTPGPNGCILWTGANDGDRGYGNVRRNGRLIKAHRYCWEMHNGPIPEGMIVCHTCDVPACVNIEHLFLSDNRGNMVDMVHKGRARPARRRRGSKLTLEQVAEIIERFKAGETQAAIAEEFGVHQSHVSRIIRRDRSVWGNCPTCLRPL